VLNLNQLRVLAAVARHGSVTAAARELHYSQPSVSHHLARLEEATGATLLQRVGRGIRLTPEGELLAGRAREILGRVEGATAELAAQVGLRAGRVRLAANQSVLSTIVPAAAAALADAHPGLELSLLDEHPGEALRKLQAGQIDVALIFRYDDTAPEPEDVRLHHLFDDPLFLLSNQDGHTIATLRDATWIAGCDRCRGHLVALCADQGFEPKIGYTSEDMVVLQSLVAAGLGVTTSPGLALRSHRTDGIVASELPGAQQRIYAATYGEPPDPPATAALLEALHEAAFPLTAQAG
jgi:DNA-binding transcriptional LysR family regulator